MAEFPESNQMYILEGRLVANHTASSAMSATGADKMVSITRIEITARVLDDLPLIGYVLAALAVADLPGKEWRVRHDGGSARLTFIRDIHALNTGSVVRLWDTLRNLALPSLELSHANG